jgi:hypothetical protein
MDLKAGPLAADGKLFYHSMRGMKRGKLDGSEKTGTSPGYAQAHENTP